MTALPQTKIDSDYIRVGVCALLVNEAGEILMGLRGGVSGAAGADKTSLNSLHPIYGGEGFCYAVIFNFFA